MKEIILNDNEGWHEPSFSRIEHYFIRVDNVNIISLCGIKDHHVCQFFDPNKIKKDLDIIYREDVKVCKICNDKLKRRIEAKGGLWRYLK